MSVFFTGRYGFFPIHYGRYKIIMALRLVSAFLYWTGWFETVGKARLGSNHAILGTLVQDFFTQLVHIVTQRTTTTTTTKFIKQNHMLQ